MSDRRPDANRPPADIEVDASVKMKSIRFEEAPETEVTFPGSDQGRSGSHTTRENLPDEVEPGVVYRNVRVDWYAGAGLRAEVADELVEAADEGEEPEK